jgi:hypothetical protein
MMKPVPDKAEIALEYPEKLHVGKTIDVKTGAPLSKA